MDIMTADEMVDLGRRIGRQLTGGQIIELIGDVGAGKTTLTKGIAEGLDITDTISSPSFTINNNYVGRDGLTLHHYDFYRLTDAGIIEMELAETLADPSAITIIEWATEVNANLPTDRIIIKIDYHPDTGRHVTITPPELLAE